MLDASRDRMVERPVIQSARGRIDRAQAGPERRVRIGHRAVRRGRDEVSVTLIAQKQERMEELEQERKQKLTKKVRDPERVRQYESLKLARTDLERQLASITHERRREQIAHAITEIDRRLAELASQLDS